MTERSCKSIPTVDHVFFFLLSVLCVVFIVWSYFGRLDVVSTADGEVIPQSKRKTIQHLEGGIIRDIAVREGQHVKKGQKLLELQGVRSKSELSEVKVRIASLQVDEVRLRAESEGEENLVFPEGLSSRHPKLVQEAGELWRQRKERLESRENELSRSVEQTNSRIEEIRSRLQSNRKEMPLLREQVELSQELMRDNLTTKYRHLELKRKLQNLNGRIQEDEATLKRAFAARKEAWAKLKTFRLSEREKASKELKETRQQLAEFLQRIEKYADNLRRTVIRSPVNGIIRSLKVSTRGAVVQPGETILDIVPSNDRLIIEAHLPIGDIGYIHPGQPARIKLASSDSRKFGDIDGTVMNISPDTVTTERGRTYYPVRVAAEKPYFESKGLKYNLYPGMIVMVYVQTGTRSVLEYLLDPFLNTLSLSMQER